jgi:hypothetical protein
MMSLTDTKQFCMSLQTEETYISTLGKSFRIIFSKLDMWHAAQVVLGKRPKKTSFGKVAIWKFKFWSDLVKEEVVRRPGEGRINVVSRPE